MNTFINLKPKLQVIKPQEGKDMSYILKKIKRPKLRPTFRKIKPKLYTQNLKKIKNKERKHTD